MSKLVSEPGAVAMGSNNSAKLDDPVATAPGSDTVSSVLGAASTAAIKSVKRTTDNRASKRLAFSRPFHGLGVGRKPPNPTDESVGYYQSSATPTFWGKPVTSLA